MSCYRYLYIWKKWHNQITCYNNDIVKLAAINNIVSYYFIEIFYFVMVNLQSDHRFFQF